MIVVVRVVSRPGSAICRDPQAVQLNLIFKLRQALANAFCISPLNLFSSLMAKSVQCFCGFARGEQALHDPFESREGPYSPTFRQTRAESRIGQPQRPAGRRLNAKHW